MYDKVLKFIPAVSHFPNLALLATNLDWQITDDSINLPNSPLYGMAGETLANL